MSFGSCINPPQLNSFHIDPRSAFCSSERYDIEFRMSEFWLLTPADKKIDALPEYDSALTFRLPSTHYKQFTSRPIIRIQ